MLHYIALHYVTLHYIASHYITLHNITLHYIALHCIALQSILIFSLFPAGKGALSSEARPPGLCYLLPRYEEENIVVCIVQVRIQYFLIDRLH